MKNGLTELVFIIDRSASLHGPEEDTIGAICTAKENTSIPDEYASLFVCKHWTGSSHPFGSLSPRPK